MIIHPEGVAIFLEVPKNGSTAISMWLRRSHGWIQNGSDMTVPNTQVGRHGWLDDATGKWLQVEGVRIYGVCRNPFERASSLWRGHAPGSQSFDDWLKRGKFMHGRVDVKNTGQSFWLQHATDILRYEHLEEDWKTAHDAEPRIIPEWPSGGIPRENVSKKKAKPEWNDFQMDWVRQKWAIDIAMGGYSGPL